MSKRQQYNINELIKAVSVVKRTKLTISQVSRDFGIPRKTISDHLHGNYTNHQHCPDKILTEVEEASLVEYIKYMLHQGFPMTRAIVRQYVITIVKEKEKPSLINMNKGPSDKWFRKFFSRHPELTERVAERQDRSRARMSNQAVMDNYFRLLQEEVTRLGLQHEPGRIFNCDETGWNGKEKSRQKVIGVKGRHTYQQALSSSGHITAHLCISADGKVLPTFLIFEKSLPHTSYREGVPSNWLFGHSDSGYMDSQLFYIWFRDLFLTNCGRRRPVLLVMDNHDSHINLDLVKLARENDVVLLGLPPHTTHILQPLDVGINGPLKAKFNAVAVNLGHVNKHQVLNKAKFPVILSHAIDQFCSPAKVKSAFRKSGLYPVDKEAIDSTQVAPSLFKKKMENKTAEETSCVEPIRESSTTSAQSATCASCGTFLGGNPLVLEGLVPEDLAHIFPPVPSKPQAARRKIVTDARVITSEKIFKQLEDKILDEERRKAEIIKRRVAREERKRVKEEQARTKSKKKQERSTEDESERCTMCDRPVPQSSQSEDVVLWISCEQCAEWYHQECVGLIGEDVEDVYFVCVNCCADNQ